MNETHQLTPRAQRVFFLARQEAERLNHDRLGTEHLLLGLIELADEGVAVQVLRKAGLSSNNVRTHLQELIETGTRQNVSGEIPYSPLVRKVVSRAAKEASALDHTYVGTEDILLALLSAPEGVVPRLLERLGVDGERICQEVRKEIDPNFFEVPRGLTPAAEQVIWAARTEAERFQHKFLSTEHLLLALIKIGDGIAVAVLQEAGLDLETVRAEVEQLVGPNPDKHTRSPIRYAPRVKAILLAAAEEARVLERAEVGPDHLALALLREDRGVAALVLRNLNLDVEQIRRDVLKRLA